MTRKRGARRAAKALGAPKRSLPAARMERFVLADPQRYRPEGIVARDGNDRLSAFVLALAQVYNDLKGVLLFREWFLPLKPPPSEVSAHAGQWTGLLLQSERLIMGLLHELFELIKSFEAEASGPVRALLSDSHPKIRGHWNDLVGIATGVAGETDARFARVLVQVRNNAAFHYYQPKALVAGYRKHFFNSPPSPRHEFAFASMGRNMEQTRFYFADAAMQGMLKNVSAGFGERNFSKRLVAVTDAVNQTIREIVGRYIEPSELDP